jgi:hypothetical protein
MNKNICLSIVAISFVLALVSSAHPAYAYWWNPWPKCSELNIPGCCNDDCSAGERVCTDAGTKMATCGTEYRADKCYHFPTLSTDKQTCSFGCDSSDGYATCFNTDPCAGGINGCPQEGATRCATGYTCGGPGMECTLVCMKGINNCNRWSAAPKEICDLGCSGGTCFTFGNYSASTCSQQDTKCDDSGRYVISCVKDNPNDANSNVWRWSTNKDDSGGWRDGTGWFDCGSSGKCTGPVGAAHCEVAGITVPDCNFLDTRCDPEYPNFLQICDFRKADGTYTWNYNYVKDVFGNIQLNQDGTKKRDMSAGTDCKGTCHLGSCVPYATDPTIYKCADNCTVGNTRCGGTGNTILTCGQDKYSNTGCNVWQSEFPCPSGRCENGACVSKFSGGEKIKMWTANLYSCYQRGVSAANLPTSCGDNFWDGGSGTESNTVMFSDGIYVYIGGVHKMNITVGSRGSYDGNGYNYTVEKFDVNGTWLERKYFNITGGMKYKSAAAAYYDEYDRAVWAYADFFAPAEYPGGYISTGMLMKFTSEFSTNVNWTSLPVNVARGITADQNFIYILNSTTGPANPTGSGSGKSGVLVYWKSNMTLANQFCLTSSYTTCAGNQSVMYYDKGTDRIYVLNQKNSYFVYNITAIGGSVEQQQNLIGGKFSPGYNFEVQIYSTKGYYYGSYALNPNTYYSGMTKIAGRWYFLTPTTFSVFCADGIGPMCNSISTAETYYLEIWNDIESVKSDCVNGSSQCTGYFNNQIQNCVQTPTGQWKWYTSDADCNSLSKAAGLCKTTTCANGCTDAWANHIYKVAQCKSNNACTDQCNITETSCDGTNRYVKNCVYGNLYDVGYIGNVSPVAQYCNHWDNYLNWTPCNTTDACINGQCVSNTISNCNAGEARCLQFATADNKMYGTYAGYQNDIVSLYGQTVFQNLKESGTSILAVMQTCQYNSNLKKYIWEPVNNATPCYWGCQENVTNDNHFASCRDADKLYVAARSQVNEMRGALWILAGHDDNGKIFIVAIFMAVTGIISAIYVSWKFAVINSMLIAVSAAMVNWFGIASLPILAFFIVVVIYMMYRIWSSD